MSETTIAVIKDVTGEKKQGQDGEVILYTIQAEGGPFKSWQQEVGQAAFNLKGQTAEINYEVKTRTQGDRTFHNKFIKNVRASSTPVSTGSSGIPITGGQESSANSGNLVQQVPVSEDQAPARMSRGNGVKVAAHILAFPEFEGKRTTENLFKLADAIAGYVTSGEKPASVQTQPVVTDPDDLKF